MPADSEARASVPPLPQTYRPLGTRLVAVTAAVALVGAVVILWAMLPGSVRDDFTAFQRITLLVVFAVILVVLYGLFRTSARADDSGLRVVNLYRATRLEWPQVVALSLHPNRAWAVLDLDDGDTLAVMAIQNSDGARAARAARELARIITDHSQTARND